MSIQDDNLYAYNRYGISSPRCNQTSWIAWFLLIQYFFLAKRFLTSLLTAMFGLVLMNNEDEKSLLIVFSLTGARVQSQSEQIWMYNRYEIVMEYAKRPRLPPPFVVISYISQFLASKLSNISCCFFSGMLISNGSRQCVLKLKVYSDKRANSSPRSRRKLNESKNDQDRELSNLNIDISTSQLTESNENHSLLGRLLNCKPCRRVTDTQKRKIVCFSLLKKIPKRNA
jgi:hypothetical protein